VTDLLKRACPIIRYRLNDIVTISPEPCPCGSSFRVIERVQGRSDDLFWARRESDGAWQFIFPDYVSRAIISSSEDIDEYQVVQEAPNLVLVRLSLKAPGLETDFDRDAVAVSLRALFREYGCAEPEVRVAFGPPERNPASDKLIRIHRNFTAEGIE
jgi:phenylacetate-coenzyme A ligase PaaK-like adenylate-forming protein